MDSPSDQTDERHLTCSMSSTLLRRMRAEGGERAVAEVLERAGSKRPAGYLEEVSNWISHGEAIALMEAAVEVTGDPTLPRRVGEDALRQHAGTPTATLLRSQGSPEEVYRQITLMATKFSTVTLMEPVSTERGCAKIRAVSRPGFHRHPHLCDWAKGLLTTTTMLYGLPPATVTEAHCQAHGADECLYTMTWDPDLADKVSDPAEHIVLLEAQLAAALRQLDGVYATARELVSARDLESILATVVQRAATAVRAPRYLLAVRPRPTDDLHIHSAGMGDEEARELAPRLLETADDELPGGWLVAEVASDRRSYGRLAAMYSGGGEGFHSQERDLLQTYARLAAAVLDSATSLDESRSLLALARALAVAGTSDEVAERLAAAVPDVVDCDRVAVFLWDEAAGELSCRAAGGHGPEMADKLRSAVITPADTPTLQRFLDDDEPRPVLFEADTDDAYVAGLMRVLGDAAVLVVPIVARGRFLGILNVAAITRPERLRPSPGLLELLQGVAAQAATAIENGRLVDGMAHQARHDALTGLANRVLFTERAEAALDRARRDSEPVALVYADLNGFKAVNDSLGHSAGDELLDQVAQRLAATVRAGDTLARLGGDEFALLAPGVSRSEAEALAERASRAFAKPFTIAGRELTVGVSVGVAVFPDDAHSLESLLTGADAAMYAAKRQSRLRAAA